MVVAPTMRTLLGLTSEFPRSQLSLPAALTRSNLSPDASDALRARTVADNSRKYINSFVGSIVSQVPLLLPSPNDMLMTLDPWLKVTASLYIRWATSMTAATGLTGMPVTLSAVVVSRSLHHQLTPTLPNPLLPVAQ